MSWAGDALVVDLSKGGITETGSSVVSHVFRTGALSAVELLVTLALHA